ncbi:MAG: hypothetical protein VSS75_009600 [Candidatus Parabeggiatoa sp.]|nr:hypothetical protein [Candidatus Parabeggiatoa sp.]
MSLRERVDTGRTIALICGTVGQRQMGMDAHLLRFAPCHSTCLNLILQSEVDRM